MLRAIPVSGRAGLRPTALYSRRWLPGARRFLAQHRALLRERPVWYFALGIRIDDLRSASSRHGSRYNGERQVAAGTSEIRLSLDEVRQAPEGRQLDLAHIRRLVLFTGDESVGREFVINSAFLN